MDQLPVGKGVVALKQARKGAPAGKARGKGASKAAVKAAPAPAERLFKVLGNGSYGAVFTPAVQCEKEWHESIGPGMVSKVYFDTKWGDAEALIAEHVRLAVSGRYGAEVAAKFFIFPHQTCSIDMDTVHPYLYGKNAAKVKRGAALQSVMSFGGVTLHSCWAAWEGMKRDWEEYVKYGSRFLIALQGAFLGLTYLGECEFVHYDIKTDNIMLETDPVRLGAQVIDFGYVDAMNPMSVKVHQVASGTVAGYARSAAPHANPARAGPHTPQPPAELLVGFPKAATRCRYRAIWPAELGLFEAVHHYVGDRARTETMHLLDEHMAEWKALFANDAELLASNCQELQRFSTRKDALMAGLIHWNQDKDTSDEEFGRRAASILDDFFAGNARARTLWMMLNGEIRGLSRAKVFEHVKRALWCTVPLDRSKIDVFSLGVILLEISPLVNYAFHGAGAAALRAQFRELYRGMLQVDPQVRLTITEAAARFGGWVTAMKPVAVAQLRNPPVAGVRKEFNYAGMGLGKGMTELLEGLSTPPTVPRSPYRTPRPAVTPPPYHRGPAPASLASASKGMADPFAAMFGLGRGSAPGSAGRVAAGSGPRGPLPLPSMSYSGFDFPAGIASGPVYTGDLGSPVARAGPPPSSGPRMPRAEKRPRVADV